METTDNIINQTLQNATITDDPFTVPSFQDNLLLDYIELNLSQPILLPPVRDPLYVVIPITFIYILIVATGLIGNISTCIVIAKHRSMHTATNYYLFSLAISDLCLLISGAPQEVYQMWSKYPYIFGELFCVLRGLMAETSANATVLTITSFTVERYLAICHPFLQHTMSKLSRAIRLILVVWIVSLLVAIPMALQFGTFEMNGVVVCDVKRSIIEHSFEMSTLFFFLAPMTLITVLYVLIGLKLRSSCLMKRENGVSVRRQTNVNSCRQQNSLGTRRVIKMLVAVVVAFILCWAPFHAQRLIAFYDDDQPVLYAIMTYTSGILYYLSTCINPLLYNLMSNKFREAFKETLAGCGKSTKRTNDKKRSYRVLSRGQRRWNATQDSGNYSGSSYRGESLYSTTTQKQSFDSVTMSRTESVKYYRNGHLPHPLCIEMEATKLHCDSSTGSEPLTPPIFTNYKIKYTGNGCVAELHLPTDSSISRSNRHQMLTALVQHLTRRRSSQDNFHAASIKCCDMKKQETKKISQENIDQGFEDAQDPDSDVKSVNEQKDELTAYMEEIRMRELR